MKVEFTVMGEPQGKGRPRFARHGGRVVTHTPEKTAAYESLIRAEYARSCGRARFGDGDQLMMSVRAYLAIPKSAPRARREAMEAGRVRPGKRPDWDNIGKIVADGLNGVAYRDDAQIVAGAVAKYYSQLPRLEVEITRVGGEREISKD